MSFLTEYYNSFNCYSTVDNLVKGSFLSHAVKKQENLLKYFIAHGKLKAPDSG